jgi:alkylhydroperoxidase family enzyme
MPRIPYPNTESSHERARAASAAREKRGGKLLNLYLMLLHSPHIAEAWLGLGTAVRYGTGISDRHRELSICLIASLSDCEYEWAQHAPEAMAAGVGRGELDSLASWESSGYFDEDDRAILRYVEHASLGQPIHDDEFDDLTRLFDEQRIVELTALVGYYTGLSRFLVALGVDEAGEE